MFAWTHTGAKSRAWVVSLVTWPLGPYLKQVAGSRAGNQMGTSPLSLFTEGLIVIPMTLTVIAGMY